MGVRRTDLVLLAAILPPELYDGNKWEEDDNIYEKYRAGRDTKPGDMVIVDDGMSGRYFVAGEVIEIDYEDNGSGLGFIDLGKFAVELDPVRTEKVCEFVRDNIGIEAHPTLIVMTHWS